MPKCIICENEIQRGKRFKSPTHKSTYFCSEECYNKYLAIKTKPSSSLDKLKSYINYLWDEQVNWPYMMRQIKNLKEDYNIDENEIYMMIKYAIKYEDYKVKQEYGLLQFVQFLQPARNFAEEIKRNREFALNIEEDKIETIKFCKKNKTRCLKNDWNFD